MNMKKLFTVLMFGVLLTGCGGGNKNAKTKGGNTPADSKIIKIGGILPLTGDAATYGDPVQKAVNLRVKDINKKGGIHGKNIKMIWEDGKCNPKDASKAAQKLVNFDGVKIILGGFCSGETLGAAPITEKAKVILLSPGSSSPEVTNAGDFVFRTTPSDSSQGKVLGQLAESKYKKIGIFMEQTDYAVGVRDTFKKYFTGEIQEEDFLSNETDFKTRITKLKQSDIEALVVITQTVPKLDILLKQLGEQGWSKNIIGNEMLMNDDSIVKKYADFLGGLDEVISATFVAPENEKLEAFLKEFQTEYKEEPKYINYVSTTVDAIDILENVLNSVEDINNTEMIKKALYDTKSFPGLNDGIGFDENGDVNLTHSAFIFKAGTFKLLSE